MLRELHIAGERWPLAKPFRIARGLRTEAELVVVELRQDGRVGRGEGAPIPRYGDTVEDCVAQLSALRPAVEAGLGRGELLSAMKPGAARNALDCALWDLEADLACVTVAEAAGRPPAAPRIVAMTVGLDAPEAMREAARGMAGLSLLKAKVGREDPASRIRAVREAAPGATLIVDANESWTLPLLEAMQPVLAEAGVALLEQPLPAGEDEALRGFHPAVPVCADESCHTAADLDRLAGLYQAVNIKLDKTGGLTAAFDLLSGAQARGLTVMVGCMICTSLSIAPAFQLVREVAFADLDGPTWLTRDRDGGVRLDGSVMSPPAPGFWGG